MKEQNPCLYRSCILLQGRGYMGSTSAGYATGKDKAREGAGTWQGLTELNRGRGKCSLMFEQNPKRSWIESRYKLLRSTLDMFEKHEEAVGLECCELRGGLKR